MLTPPPSIELASAAATSLEPFFATFSTYLSLGVLLAVTAILVAHIWDRSHDV
jgi:hypothetical protein